MSQEQSHPEPPWSIKQEVCVLETPATLQTAGRSRRSPGPGEKDLRARECQLLTFSSNNPSCPFVDSERSEVCEMGIGLRLGNCRLQQRLSSNEALGKSFDQLSEPLLICSEWISSPRILKQSFVFLNKKGQIWPGHLVRERKRPHSPENNSAGDRFLHSIPGGKTETPAPLQEWGRGGGGEKAGVCGPTEMLSLVSIYLAHPLSTKFIN